MQRSYGRQGNAIFKFRLRYSIIHLCFASAFTPFASLFPLCVVLIISRPFCFSCSISFVRRPLCARPLTFPRRGSHLLLSAHLFVSFCIRIFSPLLNVDYLLDIDECTAFIFECAQYCLFGSLQHSWHLSAIPSPSLDSSTFYATSNANVYIDSMPHTPL